MLLGVNALPIRPGMTGIGSHAANLVETLALAERPETYVLIGPGTTVATRTGMHAVRVTPSSPHFEQRELPNILSRLGVDAYHSPLPSCPLVRPCPAIVTLHDVIPLARPDLTTRAFAQYFGAVAVPCLHSAEKVVTVSECSRRDIVQRTGLRAEKVRVVHQTAARRFHQPVAAEAQARVAQTYGLPPRYVLYVGSVEPRKNIECLVEALATVPNAPLVMVGRAQEDYGPGELIERRHLWDRVRWLGYVPDEDLPAVYALADVFAFPSWYEGFGLPVLEAMASGCPVVASSATSLPEVGGAAMLYADPASPAEWASRIRSILESPELREELRTQGRKRAAEFSPERYAAELLGIYDELLA